MKIPGIIPKSISGRFILVALFLTATLASATHPGKNGRIVFVADRTGSLQIYTMNRDGSDIFQVTNLPPAIDGLGWFFDVSPDGKKIVFTHDMSGELELYGINVDGTGLQQITHGASAAPRWSPDGTHIVFTALGRRFGAGIITTMRADGTGEKFLSSPFWDSLGASYTQDGKHIIFSTQSGGYIATLWVMDADGRNQKLLTAPALEAGPYPDISPDNKQAVFYNHQDTPKPTFLYKMNIDGTHPVRLTAPGHNDIFGVYSPDGTKILFMSDRLSAPNFDIFIMNADGSNQKLFIPGGLLPVWAVATED